ncbi:hypothetical protein FVE85_7289 [Porphyridium purpureum]|uniref:Band 7 domain-containing protein n=1 Tax=Porphyridium purpureum TaxID=35688 RepID=A0A5J4Z9N0_PORPP|nr:hypothetical protein FVE85_7289 [Porphyridium purpureum]|eukprot:POR5518..scf295_1
MTSEQSTLVIATPPSYRAAGTGSEISAMEFELGTSANVGNVHEIPYYARSGRAMLLMVLLACGACAAVLVLFGMVVHVAFFPFLAPLFVTFLMMLAGFVINQPNEACVLVLFGNYSGTLRATGWWWVNPFFSKRKVSLRVRVLETGSTLSGGTTIRNGDQTTITPRSRTAGKPLKVNDATGSPIDISAVVLWRVRDTAKAAFAVDDYEEFVGLQCEAALRTMASTVPYDAGALYGVESAAGSALSLRGNTHEICQMLQRDVEERLVRAGCEVLEARLNHLAYSAEIAGAMLQRQQSMAIVQARAQIVEGSVSIVQNSIARLVSSGANFDDDAKTRLVSSLLIVLCGQHSPQPVLNVG